MQAIENERLARIEERVTSVSEDVGEMKTDLKAATKIMSELHVSYVPRSELDKVFELYAKAESEQDKQIKALWKQVEHLKLWRAWLTGTLGAAMVIGMAAFEYLKQWIR